MQPVCHALNEGAVHGVSRVHLHIVLQQGSLFVSLPFPLLHLYRGCIYKRAARISILDAC